MKGRWLFTLILSVAFSLGWSQARAQFPDGPLTWTTVLKDVGAIEGLTGDNDGNFYTADRGPGGGAPCRVWKIDTNAPAPNSLQVGEIPNNPPDFPCRPSGLTFGPDGDLFITTSTGLGIIYRLTPDDTGPPFPASAIAVVYATEVPGANGVAFLGWDLFVTDGTENQGRVWKITGAGADCTPGSEVDCVEFFRIQARRNSDDLGGNVDTDESNPPPGQPFGVGSERYTVPRHEINANHQDRQAITANGIAFSRNGKTAYVADTSRGAIWAAELGPDGTLLSETGCDPTFHANTLCMDSLYVAHPLLEGVDGIALDRRGNIFGSVNERNAIVLVTDKEVVDAFQNPADAVTFLRNGDPTTDPPRPLEFPTSPFLSDRKFCTTNADSPRRDNNPPEPGEGQKVNCLDQELQVPGLPLPIN